MNTFIILAIAFVLLFIIIYRFKITVNAHIDLTRLESAFSVKILFFKAFEGKLKIKNFELILCTNKCEEIPIDVKALIYGEKYTDVFMGNLILNLNIKRLYLFITSCVAGDLYYNIMSSALLNILNKIAAVLIKANSKIDFKSDINTEYEKNLLELTLNCIIRTSIADIIYIAIKSIFDKFKKIKKRKSKIGAS